MSEDAFTSFIWLLWAACWFGLFAIGYGLVIGVVKLFRWLRTWFIARRNERLLAQKRMDIRIAHAAKLAFRMGWLPEEYKRRVARFNEETQ